MGEGRREVKVKLSSLFKKARGQERQPLGKSRVVMRTVGKCFILEFHKQPFFQRLPLGNMANFAVGANE